MRRDGEGGEGGGEEEKNGYISGILLSASKLNAWLKPFLQRKHPIQGA